jgi:hypothetical protein
VLHVYLFRLYLSAFCAKSVYGKIVPPDGYKENLVLGSSRSKVGQ